MKKILITLLLILFFSVQGIRAQSGYALSLPGGSSSYTSSSMTIPALSSLITGYPFTVEMWVTPTSWVSYGGFWVDRISSSIINSVQYDNNSSGYLRSDLNGNARFVSALTSNAIPNIGLWNHISMIVRSDSVIVELNGVYYKAANSISWNSSFFSTNTYIGSDPVVNGRNVAGLFDEIRIWNTARTKTEIEADKSKVLTGTETGLVAYYNFDSQNVNDLTLNRKTATNYGGSFSQIVSDNDDATLSSISVSNGVLDKDFDSSITNYTAIVPATYTSTIVTATTTQTSATVNNSPSEIGESNLSTTLTCTSPSGSVTKDYTVTFHKNTVADWDGNGALNSRSYGNLWGWNCSNTTSCWSLANSSGTACRYNDITSGWTYNGANWTGRNLYIRWDGSGATTTSSVFSYPMYLESCKRYVLKLKYSWAANATVPTLATTISTDNLGSNAIVSKDLLCSSTTKEFLSDSLSFTTTDAGVYYLTIGANTAALCAVTDLSLEENTTPALSVSNESLSFDDLNTSRTFNITGNYLSDSVKISVPDGISLDKTGFSASEVQCGVTLTASFTGSEQITHDSLMIVSGSDFSTPVYVSSAAGDLSCYTPMYADKTNLMTDPFINNIANFTGWGTYGIDTTAGEPYCGTSCGKITTSGSIDSKLYIEPYTKYHLRAKVKTLGGTFQMGVSNYNGSLSDITVEAETNGEWQTIDLDFATGANVENTTTFFNNYQRTGTEGYIDNWELYKTGTLEGSTFSISEDQISEDNLKNIIREMLAKHTVYAESQYSSSGYFGNGQSVEHGARTNADYALIYAFLYKKAQDQTLPNSLTFETVKAHALAAIRYSYKTHTANKIQLCTNNTYWGLVWESSMWCTSTAYASWLIWDELTDTDKAYVKKMIVAEANYKLSTTIPTQVNSDTKAEENGWDTNILAIAAAMFPDEKNAEAWTYRCKQYAMNTYSVASDEYNYNETDGKYVRDWYIGANLFPDYALENHNFFHTSYLNIPIQEMSESLLAYKAVQDETNPTFTIPQSLKHNVKNVWDSMLKEFIMADGILAMPNGNDWSMYIFDELATYSALACIYRDPDALMLESLVLQWARVRQTTTADGAFLLNPDVAERRMAVTGRRLVFAHLYHDYFPTSDMTATEWEDFSAAHETTKYLPYSGIIRSNNKDKYVTFSWFQSADGSSYKSYMGMVSPNSPEYSNIIFPFKTSNTGNFTGYIDVSGYTRNASFIGNTYAMYPKSFATTGILNVTSGAMTKYLSFYSTPGNAVIYHEEMVPTASGTMTKDGGLMLGITTDVLTKTTRTLYSENGQTSTDGSTVTQLNGNWVNVDNVFGMVVNGGNGIAFGEKELSTSVYVSKLYGSYSSTSQSFTAGSTFLSRSAIAYPEVDATTTQTLSAKEKYPEVAAGWKATAAEDPDGRRYMLISNFRSASATNVSLSYSEGAPVFDKVTTIKNDSATASFYTTSNSSQVNELYCFVKDASSELKAVQGDDPYTFYMKNKNSSPATATVAIWHNGSYSSAPISIPANGSKYIELQNGVPVAADSAFSNGYQNVARGKHIVANDQWPEHFPFATIDDNDTTYYQSLILPTSSNSEDLTLRLWSNYSCNKIMIKSHENNGPKEVVLQSSTDGTTFTTVSTTTLENTTDWQTINFNMTGGTRYFRLKINSSYGTKNVAVSEIKLFGFPE
ncbi:MAG: LamG domain-containing protein [Paludibacter sp.]|nr:LamG domain-containing protein [Paludibacter sp.]